MSAVIPLPNEYDYLYADTQSKHAAFEQAWIAYIQSVQALQKSGTWKPFAPDWKSYCENFLPYADSTLREYRAAAVIAEIVSSVTNRDVSKEDARKLKRMVSEVIQDKTLTFSAMQVASDLASGNIPNKEQLQAGYATVVELRDSGTVSLDDGESINVADLLVQTKALENLLEIRKTKLQNVIDHTRPRKRWNGTILELQEAFKTFPEDKPLFVSWEE